jgi:O-antigen/teichoic acid export membrane protein
MALWFGPAGLALIGQFQNLLYLQQNAGGAAVHNALIQGMSQQKAEGRDEESYLRKGLALGMILSLGVALLWWAVLPWLLAPVLGGDFPLWLAILLPITVLGSAFWAGARFCSLESWAIKEAWWAHAWAWPWPKSLRQSMPTCI